MRALTILIALCLGIAVGLAIVFPAQRAVAQPGANQCGGNAEMVTKFGEWFAPGVDLDAQHRTSPAIVNDLTKPAVAVRLQLKATSPAGARWSLILRDPQLRIVAILTEEDFKAAGTSSQWTGRLEATQLSAELVGGGPGVRIQLLAGMALPANSAGMNVYSAHDPSDPKWTDPYSRPETKFWTASQAVGMLVTGASSAGPDGVTHKESWCCTGAMLTSTIFITNWHCGGMAGVPDGAFWNEAVRSNTLLDLGWHKGTQARRQYGVEALLHASKPLDYALLRVRPIIGPGAATGRAPPVTVNPTPPARGNAFIIHHAACMPKLVSFDQCTIEDPDHRGWTDPASATSGPDITHKCDTEPGASGAPVFDMSGRMIALHHLGYEKSGPQCKSDELNKAVTLFSIYADLRNAAPAVYAEVTAP